jgi:hypothetical protein
MLAPRELKTVDSIASVRSIKLTSSVLYDSVESL